MMGSTSDTARDRAGADLITILSRKRYGNRFWEEFLKFDWSGSAYTPYSRKTPVRDRILKRNLTLPPDSFVDGRWLDDGGFVVDAKDVAHDVGHFAEGAVGVDSVQE